MICIVSKENRKGDLLRLKFFSKTTRIHRLFFSRASDTKSPEQLSWNKQGRPRPMVSDPGHSKSSSKLLWQSRHYPPACETLGSLSLNASWAQQLLTWPGSVSIMQGPGSATLVDFTIYIYVYVYTRMSYVHMYTYIDMYVYIYIHAYVYIPYQLYCVKWWCNKILGIFKQSHFVWYCFPPIAATVVECAGSHV